MTRNWAIERTEMNIDTPNDSSPSAGERVPSIGELYRQQLPEMKAATTKEEAYEAIRPLVGLAAMYDRMPMFEKLPPGGGIVPERVAAVTPLTEQEVEDEIVEKSWEFIELVAEEND